MWMDWPCGSFLIDNCNDPRSLNLAGFNTLHLSPNSPKSTSASVHHVNIIFQVHDTQTACHPSTVQTLQIAFQALISETSSVDLAPSAAQTQAVTHPHYPLQPTTLPRIDGRSVPLKAQMQFRLRPRHWRLHLLSLLRAKGRKVWRGEAITPMLVPRHLQKAATLLHHLANFPSYSETSLPH